MLNSAGLSIRVRVLIRWGRGVASGISSNIMDMDTGGDIVVVSALGNSSLRALRDLRPARPLQQPVNRFGRHCELIFPVVAVEHEGLP